jgi:hypothetical protein
VHENDGIALAFVEIGDFNSAVVEARHRSCPCFEGLRIRR